MTSLVFLGELKTILKKRSLSRSLGTWGAKRLLTNHVDFWYVVFLQPKELDSKLSPFGCYTELCVAVGHNTLGTLRSGDRKPLPVSLSPVLPPWFAMLLSVSSVCLFFALLLCKQSHFIPFWWLNPHL